MWDQTVYVHQSVDNAATDLLVVGGRWRALVLFLTLRSIGATLVVAVSMPISIIGTFLGLSLTGRNLNVISMAGLTFAIGMGVDNTIVVLENIFRHREMGKDRLAAAIDGSKEVWGAILAATLANIAVFLPVVFIKEEAGQLFKDISIAISISLLLYLFISPTVIPVLATLFLRKMPGGFVEGGGGEPDTKRRPRRLGGRTAPFARLLAFSRSVLQAHVVAYARVRAALALIVILIVVALVGSWLLMPPRVSPRGQPEPRVRVRADAAGLQHGRVPRHGAEDRSRPEAVVGMRPGGRRLPQVLAEKKAKLEQLQKDWRQARDDHMVPGMEQMIDGMKQA